MVKNKKYPKQQEASLGKGVQHNIPQAKCKMRKALTVIELTVVLFFVGIVAVAVYSNAGKLFSSVSGDTEHQRVTSVMGGIERSKKIHGSVYPASGGANLSTITDIITSMGGPEATADVANWTYSCAAGSNTSVVVTTTDYESKLVRDLVIGLINTNNQPWTAKESGDAVVFTKANVTCTP